MRANVYLLASVLGLGSCSKNASVPPPLPEHTMVPLYADVLIIRERAAILRQDSLRIEQQIDSLLQRYQTTRAQMEESLRPFKNNLAMWKEFYAKVGQRLEEMQRDTSRMQ